MPPHAKNQASGASVVSGQPPAPGDERIDPLLRIAIDQVGARWSQRQPLAVEVRPEELPVALEQEGLAEPLAQVFVRTDDVESTLRAIEPGGRHSTVTSGIVVGAIPLFAVRALAARAETRFIEGSRWQYPTLDASRPEIKADQVQAGTGLAQPYDGTGEIVGVLDSGIDWSHPDFQDGSGKSRILYLWDMSREGKPPSDHRRLRVHEGRHRRGALPGDRRPGRGGHGTHTSGTVAGNGSRSGGTYRGIAPNANIIFVKGLRTTDSSGSFASADVADGINYIFQKGAALGRPVSINMSLGSQGGPHDGSSAYEQTLQGLTGPGKILSVSAGNDGAWPVHLGYTTQGTDYVSGISTDILPSSSATSLGVILVAPPGVSVGLVGQVTSGGSTTYCNGIGPVTTGYATPQTTMSCSGTMVGYAKIDGTFSSGGLTQFVVSVSNNGVSGVDFTKAVWELYTFGSSRIDAWVYSGGKFSTLSDPSHGWLAGDTSMTVGIPATANGLIAVAAYSTKTHWTDIDGATQSPASWCYLTPDIFVNQIACFSSLGPTRDGRQKPDIAAPGMFIVAPLGGSLDPNDSGVRPNIVLGGYYRVDQGTSMAAPHVAGVVALMLQANHSLTPAQALLALQQTARHDSFTGSVPNLTWGSGKVDALAALKAVGGGSPSVCTAGAHTMCLVGGRYRVTSQWTNQYAGDSDVSTLNRTTITDATGAFWLTDPSTFEYLIRIQTATTNGRAWIAIPTFTDVEFSILVEDMTNGQYKTYHSAPGNRTLIYDPYFFVYP